MKRIFSILLLAVTLTGALFCLSSCGKKTETVRIGVIREDDTSGEATAWESYLRTVGGELGFEFDFTTTNSSAAEVAAINTYASKGYAGIFLFSDDDRVASINAAESKKLYVICPTGHPTEEQDAQLKNLAYYLGSVAPDDEDDFKAGYDMAKFFVEEKQQNTFTIFGGATSYGSTMHVQRLLGMLTYLCEDSTTSYAGVKTRAELLPKVSGIGLDPAKFKSDRYKITGYMDGFTFDDAFSTKLTGSLEAGGTCILAVGGGDLVSKIAYGITSSSPKVESFLSGGVDAITADYADCFDLGYTYDCGKFASAMGPALVMMKAALNGKKITSADGRAPRLRMEYWIATNRQMLEDMLKNDNKNNGYCYNSAVLNHFIEAASYSELEKLCSADYEESLAIHRLYAGNGTNGEVTGDGQTASGSTLDSTAEFGSDSGTDQTTDPGTGDTGTTTKSRNGRSLIR